MCKNSHLEGCDVLWKFWKTLLQEIQENHKLSHTKSKKKTRFRAFIIQDLDLKVLAEMMITDYAISLRLGVWKWMQKQLSKHNTYKRNVTNDCPVEPP